MSTKKRGVVQNSSVFENEAVANAMTFADQGYVCGPCDESGVPTPPKGLGDFTKDKRLIYDLFVNFSGTQVGVATGSVSGLIVLEIDFRNGGDYWLRERIERFPKTRVECTEYGLIRFIFSVSTDFKKHGFELAPGCLFQADGDYVTYGSGLAMVVDTTPAPFSLDILGHKSITFTQKAVGRKIQKPDSAALYVLSCLHESASYLNRLALGLSQDTTALDACRAHEMTRLSESLTDALGGQIVESFIRAGSEMATTISNFRMLRDGF